MESELRDFIDNRINNNIKEFQKRKSWKKENEKFKNKYNELYSKLTEKDKIILEDIHALFYSLSYEEQYIVYKIGLHDGFYLKSDLVKVASK